MKIDKLKLSVQYHEYRVHKFK